MKTCLWVDDERPQPEDTNECQWLVAKNFHYAITLLEYNEVDEVSLDHDLGPASVYEFKSMSCTWRTSTGLNSYTTLLATKANTEDLLEQFC